MPEGVKEKYTQICEELDQWRSWGPGVSCVHCLAHHGSASAPNDQDHRHCHFNTTAAGDPKGGHTLCDKEGGVDAKLQHGSPAQSASDDDRDGQLTSSAAAAAAAAGVAEASGGDGREGGVRYREKLRKYVVEYRPSRFKWKLWMGTYSSQQDGRRAFDCAMFYAGQGKDNYYFPDSPHVFQKLGPLQRLFSQVSKDARDRSFNLELKKRAKEVIKQTANNVHLARGGGPRTSCAPGPESCREPKEACVDPAFQDLEPLFQLRSPWSDQVCSTTPVEGLADAAAAAAAAAAVGHSGSSFFVPGLHTQLDPTPRFVLDSESDQCPSELPLWIYEMILSNSV